MSKKEMKAIAAGGKLKRIAGEDWGIRISVSGEGEPFYMKEDGSRTTLIEEAGLFLDKGLIIALIERLEAAGLEQQIKCEIVV